MNGIVLQIVCYIAVLVSFAPWPETIATSTAQPTFLSSKTFDPKGTPCEGVSCSWLKHCAVDENYQAACVCDTNCDDASFFPVCGSDNKTYSSSCAVTRKACTTNSNVTVDYNTECLHEGSLCKGITCPLNRVCAVADGRPICVCSTNCPTFANPVCGSDKQTYMNDCELRRQSCLTNKNITLDSYGECKQATKCDGFSCPKGSQCTIDERKKPVCVCNDTCPYTVDIVCGSDGRTYGSECELYRRACTSNTDIRIAYRGYCLEGSVCSGFHCPKNKQCTVNLDNKPVCICVQSCPLDYDPICGSDGVTYSNLCSLEKEACTTGTNITMARKEQCIYDAYCYGVFCPYPKTCVVDAKNHTSCACSNTCGNDLYFPLCGSDNKTYDNFCLFMYAVCQTNLSTTYYNGVCSSGSDCQGIHCPTGQHCDSLHQPKPTCVCDTVCPKTYSPVCGTNKKTYNNLCELQKDACLTNTSIVTNFNGRCQDGPGCALTFCPFDQACVVDEGNQPMCVCSPACTAGLTEVCGSDGKTYSNDCFLRAAACMTNKTIYVQRYVPCSKDNPCSGVVCSSERHCQLDQNGQPICVCNDQCINSGSPVCGSDNKTYSNICQLQKNACFSDPDIHWLNYGSCVESTASICGKISCPRYTECAVDEEYQPTCVCIEECIATQDPVCGSDGRTYYNECEMQKSACLSNRNVTMTFKGRCYKGLTCSDISCSTGRLCALNEDNKLTCVCKTDCSSEFPSPVCGTDGKTYATICHLQREACTNNKNIVLDYAGPCTHDAITTEIPCVGALCSTSTLKT